MNSTTRSILTCFLVCIFIGALTSCAQISYYAQSVRGHFSLLAQKQSIDEYLENENLAPDIRQSLQKIQLARSFARNTLNLPMNDSYSEYVHLNRDYVVQNLIAAQEFSTELHAWCYPFIGCANYKGYFDEPMLRRDQSELSDKSFDTHVYKVTAYSTLGWFDDPVLSTFLALPEYQLVGLIFHEIAHQQIYIAGDTAFNESFATAVEQAGLALFYEDTDKAHQLARYRTNRDFEEELIKIAQHTRNQLAILYAKPITDALKRKHKRSLFIALEERYRMLATKAGRVSELDTEFPGEFNNARLGVLSAYHDYVQGFLSLLQFHKSDFKAFYSHVEALGKLAAAEREQCLRAWASSAPLHSGDSAIEC